MHIPLVDAGANMLLVEVVDGDDVLTADAMSDLGMAAAAGGTYTGAATGAEGVIVAAEAAAAAAAFASFTLSSSIERVVASCVDSSISRDTMPSGVVQLESFSGPTSDCDTVITFRIMNSVCSILSRANALQKSV